MRLPTERIYINDFPFASVRAFCDWLAPSLSCALAGNIPAPNLRDGYPEIAQTCSMYWLARISSIVRVLTCPFSSSISFVCGSSFFTGLFRIRAALAAYVRVMLFSSKYWSLRCKHAIMQLVELPPRLCLSRHVNLLSR